MHGDVGVTPPPARAQYDTARRRAVAPRTARLTLFRPRRQPDLAA